MAIEQASQGLGPVLREARTRRGIPLGQAARDTCISVTYLEALEANAPIHAFTAPVYARGFLREYARYLGLDAAPLLEQFERSGRVTDPATRARTTPLEAGGGRLRRWWTQRASGGLGG